MVHSAGVLPNRAAVMPGRTFSAPAGEVDNSGGVHQFPKTGASRASAPASRPAPATVREDTRDAGLLGLQHEAGNRAVASLIASRVVQRHEGMTTNEEMGEPSTAEAPVETTAPAGPTTEPGTGTGTTGPKGSGLTGDARTKAITDLMNASATGMWAMGVISKWKIPVDYEYAGQGSYHSSGKIYLNKTLSVGAAASVLMHEAQHADTYKSGSSADPNKMGREEYIKKKIADEAEAVVRQIEGMAVTVGLGYDVAGSGVSDALKERYLKAFYAKRDELEKANPKMSTGEINVICRKHVRDTEVTNWFWDGTFITSTDKNSYGVFYGDQWDKANKPPAKK